MYDALRACGPYKATTYDHRVQASQLQRTRSPHTAFKYSSERIIGDATMAIDVREPCKVGLTSNSVKSRCWSELQQADLTSTEIIAVSPNPFVSLTTSSSHPRDLAQSCSFRQRTLQDLFVVHRSQACLTTYEALLDTF